MRTVLLLMALVSCQCGVQELGDQDPALSYDKMFNTVTITSPKSLLDGYHLAFDTPAQSRCVKAADGAKPSVDNATESFDLEYKESKQELRSFFNLTAQAQANLVLIHAKANIDIANTLNQDDAGVFFGLHSSQTYTISYDAKNLSLTDDTVTRLSNSDKRPLDTIAKEQIFQCGPGYVRGVQVGGELDGVLKITASDYSKTASMKKSLEVSGIGTSAKWYSDSKFTDQMKSATVSVDLYAAGFSFNGKPVSSAIANAYVNGQIAAAVKGGQNTVVAAVTALQALHTAMKESVTKDQNGDQSCTSGLVFQAELGNYYNLNNVPERCGADSIVDLQKRTNELADLMGTQSLAFDTAELACARAEVEIQSFFQNTNVERPGSWISSYGFETKWHQNGTQEGWVSRVDMMNWVGLYSGANAAKDYGEFNMKDKSGVRVQAVNYYNAVKKLLSGKPGDIKVIDFAIREPKKVLQWLKMVKDPRDYGNAWNRYYYWNKPTYLRNLWTYANFDRIRPVYVLSNTKDVNGIDVKSGKASCAAGSRIVNTSERFPIAPWMAMPANVRVNKYLTYWIWTDPATECPEGKTAVDSLSYVPPAPDPDDGPADSLGRVSVVCADANEKRSETANLVCVPTDQGIFGGTNPFNY